MSYCTNCGRKLAENEVCTCKSNQQTNPLPPPPQFDYMGRPLFTAQGEPITYDENGNAVIHKNKSNKNGCLIAIIVTIIVTLIIGAILAAILVPAMLGYVKKSKVQNANAMAKTIYRSMNSALVEMDASDIKIDGKYIICSDKSNNMLYNNDIDTDALYSIFYEYAVLSDECEWFAIIEDGTVVYVAYEEYEDHIVGTYPVTSDSLQDNIPVYNSTGTIEDADLDDLYEFAVMNIT